MSTIYLNGEFLAPELATVSVMDRGFLFGDGVYEVIPAYGGRPFRLAGHLQRLRNSLQAIRVREPMNDAQWHAMLEELLRRNPGEDQSIYLQVTRGVMAKRDHAFDDSLTPTIFAMVSPIAPPDPAIARAGVRAVTLNDIRWQSCHIKAITLLPNVLLRQEAIDSGAVEAILIKDGHATEGAASNLFIVRNGLLITPPKGPHLLPGITRDLILELAARHAIPYREAGIRKLTTETGAGQWGSSLAFAGSLFGIDVTVFQVRVSYDQKPYRRALMETYGAKCIASPSNLTNSGRAILAQNPDHPGSLGIAISEAVEIAATHDDTKYALGSVLNHVLLHQTIIGLEAMQQLEMAGDDPDVVVGCTGGGSNFAGISFPFIGQQLRGGGKTKQRRIVAVEPSACPSLTRGKFAYDFGDTAHLTPLTKMHTLGSTFTPPGFHAGGLRYHGMAPLVSHLKELGLIEATAYPQTACFEAGVLFARAEGIVPAPEANHAVKGAIVEALRCKAEGRAETILFNLCGHGHFDMQAYIDYFGGKLQDLDYDEAELAMALSGLPSVPETA